MRYSFLLAAIAMVLAGCHDGMHHHDNAEAKHLMYVPADIKWVDGPPGLPAGGQFAVLEGDPHAPGFFTMRAKLPANYNIMPHWHPQAERVTVLSGALYMGHGDSFNKDGASALPAGSYTSMPAGMHHFAYTKEETVIQLSGIGPWGITYVNAADDPRKIEK